VSGTVRDSSALGSVWEKELGMMRTEASRLLRCEEGRKPLRRVLPLPLGEIDERLDRSRVTLLYIP